MEKCQKKYSCVTKFKKEEISYKWMIQDYSLINMKPKEFMESLIFKPPKNDKLSWKLKFYPQGKHDAARGFTSLWLQHVSGDNNDFSMKMEFLVLDGEGRSARKYEFRVLKPFKMCGTDLFVKNDDLFKKSNNLLPGDNLTLVCNIKLCINNDRTNSQTETRGIGKLQFSPFNNRLQLLLESEELSDVILIASNGEELYGHKALLAAQSSVFMTIFKNKSKRERRRTIRVEVPEFDIDIVRAMLQYMYTGKFEKQGEKLYELVRIADKYAIEELKNNCEHALINNLSLDNVIRILILASKFNMKFLEEHANIFFCDHIKDLVKLPACIALRISHPLIWKSITNSIQSIEIRKEGNGIKRKIGEMN